MFAQPIREVTMPLLDHFAEDADPQLNWESFHSTWANCIRDAFHQILPPRYFALIQTHLGIAVEADVAEFERQAGAVDEEDNGETSAGGVAVQAWAPPRATMVLPAQFPDAFEIEIRERHGARLVGSWSWSVRATRTVPRAGVPSRASVPLTSSAALA
jgi:hypothetical protein